MNTVEDWKRERMEQEGCRYCNGSGWRPSTYSSGPSPCGCDEPQEDDTAEPHHDHIAETFNEFGTPVSMFRCFYCRTVFTACPAVEPEKHDQWIGCMAEGCASYDEARDGDKLFEAGKVQRVGDRSRIQVVEEGK